MAQQEGIHQFLTGDEIVRLGRLSVASRYTVEGSVAGAHRSKLKGVSVEFADYRQYVPGDDPKHLDWRVFGRNEKLFLREYEEETSLRLSLLVDSSNSMSYTSGGNVPSKYHYSATLAVALAYLVIHRQDSVGLAIFDHRCRVNMPPRGGADHLRLLANALASHQPGENTDLAGTLHALAEQSHRRGLVVIFSDLFDDVERIRAALAHFRRRRHDVIVYQVLDRAELELPFREAGVFEDLESGERITAAPSAVRGVYQTKVAEFLAGCRRACAGLGIDYQLLVTDRPPIDSLIQHLRQRALAGR